MKKILCVMLILALVAGMSGCMRVEEGIVINEDGSGTISSTMLFEKESYDLLMTNFAEQGYTGLDVFDGKEPEIVVIDGTEFYFTNEEKTFASLEELEEQLSAYNDVHVSKTGIRFVLQNEADMSYEETQAAYDELGVDLKNVVKGFFRITMPETILKCSSGGKISEDGMTAAFEFDYEQLCGVQDIMVSTAKETEKPSMSVTHKKTYKNTKTVTVKDESGIKEAKFKKKGGEYVPFGLSQTFSENGTYTVTAKDYYGNTRTRSFTIKDETKPQVKGVTDKKTYTSERKMTFSDNCGVSSVTVYIDGNKIRLPKDQIPEGYVAIEPADYKIYIKDINGNSRTVKFTIK